MKNKRLLPFLVLLLFLLLPFSVLAQILSESEFEDFQELKLRSHENSYVGFTDDNDDEAFMDFKISVRYPVRFDGILFNNRYLPFLYRWRLADYLAFNRDTITDENGMLAEKAFHADFRSHFAFSGRFGQYIGTRISSPVVGKRFNPFIFEEITWAETSYPIHFLDDTLYHNHIPPATYFSLAFGLGHESNGMDIRDIEAYCSRIIDIRRNDPESDAEQEVKDYISRGWDYIGVNLAYYNHSRDLDVHFTARSRMQFFLETGPLQGLQENYNYWEEDLPKYMRRDQVNGFNVSLSFVKEFEYWIISNFSAQLSIESGIYRWKDPVLTPRWDFGITVGGMPMIIWYTNGYTSDIAQFGKRVESFGVAANLATFDLGFF